MPSSPDPGVPPAFRKDADAGGPSLSLSREYRRPLFGEGADALGVVGCVAGFILKVAFEVELLVERVALGGVERALGQGVAGGRASGEPGGQRLRLGHQLVVIDRAPDEAPFGGALGRERLGEDGQRAGAGGADEAREKPGAAAIGDEADARESLDEIGRFGASTMSQASAR